MECEPTTFDQQSEAIAATVLEPVMVKGVSVRSTKLHQRTSEFINARTASNQHSNRPESPTLTLHASKYKVYKLHQRYILKERLSTISSEDVLLVECMYLVFTRMQGESYSRRLTS